MRAHGDYSIEIRGHVVEVTVQSTWNAEGMAEFIEDFKRACMPFAGSAWAALVDLTNWELATPETAEQMDRLQEWCLANNQIYEAMVMAESALVEAQIKRYSMLIEDKLEQRYFSDRIEAQAWLNSLGMYE